MSSKPRSPESDDAGRWTPGQHWPQHATTSSRASSAGERTEWFTPVSCRKR